MFFSVTASFVTLVVLENSSTGE